MAAVATQLTPQAPCLDRVDDSSRLLQTGTSLRAALLSLKPQLSEQAAVHLLGDKTFETSVQRYSDYKRPTPGASVHVATEQDIVATVRWATSNGVPLLAQSGRHDWCMTLAAVGKNAIIVDLRGMNSVRIDMGRGIAALGAGTSTGELLKAGQDAGCHFATASCDTVGAVASIMGGGVGNHISNFGLGSDNIVSARVVTSDGSVVTASSTENSDLFWGLRGAGHHFGIVSELTVKAHPQINEGKAWSGILAFPGSPQITETVLRTIEEMGITEGRGPEGRSCTVVYGRPAPTFKPAVILKLSFNGSTQAAMSAFAPLYALTQNVPTIINESKLVPASELNEIKDSVCGEGGPLDRRGFRPVHSASLSTIDIPIMSELYRRWEQFTEAIEDTKHSVIRIDCYDYRHVQSVPAEDSAFGWRQNPIEVLQFWSYTDSTLHDEIESLGRVFRQALTGDKAGSVMMSFASGDETSDLIYGDKLDKLRNLKMKWDRKGAFSFNKPFFKP